MKALPTAVAARYGFSEYRDDLTLVVFGRTFPQDTENGN